MEVTQAERDRQFLDDVARLEADGLQLKEIAARLEIVPSTLTYRLARLGYANRNQIVDARTGEPLAARLQEPAEAA